jgi:hypothetical protein
VGSGGLVESSSSCIVYWDRQCSIGLQLVLHSVPGLGSAQLRTTKAGLRGQTRRRGAAAVG